MASATPTAVRYIKLGESGSWFDECIDGGLLKFADLVPHGVARTGDRNAIRQVYEAAGRKNPNDAVRELLDFYTLDSECLWITFGRERLWWTFAEAEVTLSADGFRYRRTLTPWRCTDVAGRELRAQDLSTSLTQVGSYRRTICSVAAQDYLLRRINSHTDPLLERLEHFQAGLANTLESALRQLHWRDLELLVDLILSRSGWRRLSSVGGSRQADSDIIMEQLITGERIFVQAKSRAQAAILNDYVGRFERYPGVDRLLLACHTWLGRPPEIADTRVQVWGGPELAKQVVGAGLVDWVLERLR
jgi:hypothetical protein